MKMFCRWICNLLLGIFLTLCTYVCCWGCDLGPYIYQTSTPSLNYTVYLTLFHFFLFHFVIIIFSEIFFMFSLSSAPANKDGKELIFD